MLIPVSRFTPVIPTSTATWRRWAGRLLLGLAGSGNFIVRLMRAGIDKRMHRPALIGAAAPAVIVIHRDVAMRAIIRAGIGPLLRADHAVRIQTLPAVTGAIREQREDPGPAVMGDVHLRRPVPACRKRRRGGVLATPALDRTEIPVRPVHGLAAGRGRFDLRFRGDRNLDLLGRTGSTEIKNDPEIRPVHMEIDLSVRARPLADFVFPHLHAARGIAEGILAGMWLGDEVTPRHPAIPGGLGPGALVCVDRVSVPVDGGGDVAALGDAGPDLPGRAGHGSPFRVPAVALFFGGRAIARDHRRRIDRCQGAAREIRRREIRAAPGFDAVAGTDPVEFAGPLHLAGTEPAPVAGPIAGGIGNQPIPAEAGGDPQVGIESALGGSEGGGQVPLEGGQCGLIFCCQQRCRDPVMRLANQ